MADRRTAPVVVACHFVASFAALGLPPFFPVLLPQLGDPEARWAGVLYVVPTVCVALSAPFWGRLADRYGRKRLLLRAQLGLAVSFWLAGQARTLPQFTAALVLQGLLGGTFAASHAYLASALRGPQLAGGLTAMQASARAALVVAPVAVALLAPAVGVQALYTRLALLPLLAAGLVALLPEPGPRRGGAAVAATSERSAGSSVPAGPVLPAQPLYALEAAFVFATVVSFPYFLVLARQGGVGTAGAALLFALPHLLYLALASPVLAVLRRRGANGGLRVGFGAVAAGLALHAVPGTAGLVPGRVLLGAGMTAGLVALSLRTAEVARGRPAGALFGTLELFSKGGAVLAGGAASALAPLAGPAAPCVLGAAVATATVLALPRRARAVAPPAAVSAPIPLAPTVPPPPRKHS